MPKQTQRTPEQKRLHVELIKQMLSLATAGFGLVAALAWNSVVQKFVNDYIDRFLPKGSGLLSLLLYAIVVTSLAVFITYQLSKLLNRIDHEPK